MRFGLPRALSFGLVLTALFCVTAIASAAELLDPGAPWPKYQVEPLALPEGVAQGEITVLELVDLDGDHHQDLLAAWRVGDEGILAAYQGGSREWRIEYGRPLMEPVVLARVSGTIAQATVVDMDWDGRLDVLMALEGRSQLDWFPLSSPRPVEVFEIVPLPGPVTALTALDYGRRDSAASPVVGVLTAAGPNLVLFPDQKPPAGQSPLLVPTGGVVREIATGNLDGDAWWDLAVATDGGVAAIAGTDSGSRVMAREMSVTKNLVSDASGASIALDRFERSTTHRLAVAGSRGLRLVDPRTEERSESLKIHSSALSSWVRSAWSGVGRGPALVLPDPVGIRLYGALSLDRAGEWRAAEETILDLGGRVAQTKTGRINRDAIDDLVVALEGSKRLMLLIAAPRSIFGLTTQADHDDGACDADCTLREAINAANANPGYDEILSVPGLADMLFQPAIQLPTLTDSVRLNDGTFHWWVQGGSCTGGCNGLVITADACALERVKVAAFDKTPTGQSGKGIVLLDSYHSWLSLVESKNNESHGIALYDSTDTSLRGSFSENLENGIHLEPGNSGTTANNHAWSVSASWNGGDGIWVDDVPDTLIGGIDTGAHAYAERNGFAGVYVNGASATGTTVLRLIQDPFGIPGNIHHSVYLDGAGATTVGSAIPEARCQLSHNGDSGVRIQTSSANHQIANADVFDNGGHGIVIAGSANATIGPGVNVLTNPQSGVYITHDGVNDSHHITIEDSVLGSSENSPGLTGNTDYGVAINGAHSNNIGSTGHGNVISLNGAGGVSMAGPSATANNLRSNFIGTDELGSTISGNGGPGVLIVGAPSNSVGGSVGDRNVIAFNQGHGITVVGEGVDHVSLRFNSIHDNDGIGIDLGADGVTLPDPDDVDTGPNGLINQALISFAESCGGQTFVGGLRYSGAGTFTHDLLANTTCDPTGWGEGETVLVWFSTSRTSAGTYGYSHTMRGDHTGEGITSMTTDFGSSSSEFSNCKVVTAGRAGDATADCVFAADDFAAIVNVLDDPSYLIPGNPDTDSDGDVDVADLTLLVWRAFF